LGVPHGFLGQPWGLPWEENAHGSSRGMYEGTVCGYFVLLPTQQKSAVQATCKTTVLKSLVYSHLFPWNTKKDILKNV